MSPADLQAISTAAKRMAFNRLHAGDQLPPLDWSDLEMAVERVNGRCFRWAALILFAKSRPLFSVNFSPSLPTNQIAPLWTVFSFRLTFPPRRLPSPHDF